MADPKKCVWRHMNCLRSANMFMISLDLPRNWIVAGLQFGSELLLEEFCNRIEGGADTPDHLKVTRSEASSSRALATSSAREPLANRRLLYDEKRLPTFVGHPAASKFSSSATAEATLGALRA